MTKTLLTIAIVAGSMVVGCKSSNTDVVELKEPSQPKTTARAGVAPEAGHSSVEVNRLPANSLRMQWSRQLEMDGAPRDMYVRGDSLFVYSTGNTLYNLNRKSGELVFISDVAPKKAKVGAPALVGDRIAVPTDTRIRILDPRGFRDRDIQLGSPIRSGIVADDQGIYCGIDAQHRGGRIVAVELDRPFSPFRWELLAGGTVFSTPALHNGNLYAASSDGRVYAVDPDRGSLWVAIGGTFRTDGAIHADVKSDEHGVYVASADSKLYCIDPETGRLRWQYFAGVPLYDTPAVTASAVYLHVRERGVVAISKTIDTYNRPAKWVAKDAVEFLAEDASLAFFRSYNDGIIGVDKETGEVKIRSEIKGLAAFAVNEKDGLIYAATAGGKIFAAVPVTKPGEVGELVMVDLPRDFGRN